MELIPIVELEYNTTNIADDDTAIWNGTFEYAKETIRQLNHKLYKCYEKVELLSTYIYNDTDLSKPHITTRIIDNVVIDSTSVPCVKDVTIVYVVENNTYYLYSEDDNNVDFTSEDMTNPTNFTVLENGRHTLDNPEISPLIWEDLGYVNKYKMLDKNLGSQTILDGNIEASFLVSKIDRIFFFNVFAESIDIKITQIDSDIVLLDENFTMQSKDGGTFYNYFYNDFIYETKLFSSVEINFNMLIEIKINAIGNVAKCGLVAIGRSEYLGATLYGASVGIHDFSKKEVNEATGESYLKQGKVKSTNNLTIDVPINLTDKVIDVLTRYRSIPVVFIGAKEFKSTYIFGIYNKFDTLISTPTISKLTLDLESLI